MPAGDKADKFRLVRKWLKVYTQDLADPAYVRLSSAERGVLGDLERYSLRSSDNPGYFWSEGMPMPLEEILRGIQPCDIDQHAANREHVQRLRDEKWLAFNDDEGWLLKRWRDRQDASQCEEEAAEKQRQDTNERARKSKAKKAAAEAAAAIAAAEADAPIELDIVRQAKDIALRAENGGSP